jgi:hypothetical protein
MDLCTLKRKLVTRLPVEARTIGTLVLAKLPKYKTSVTPKIDIDLYRYILLLIFGVMHESMLSPRGGGRPGKGGI